MRYTLIPFVAMLALNSCAWYRDVQRSLVEDDQKQGQRSKTVTREQYDQLLVKYEELSKKYEELKEKPAQSSLVDELQTSSSENFSQGVTPPANVETVDAFPAQAPATTTSAAPAVIEPISDDLESQLSAFRKAMALKASNSGEATKIFQQLEQKGHPAVKVRAKFELGEMLFQKQQYDLSLQVFEDIIQKYSYSGVVLDALKYAQAASEKLGLQAKREQYASMLSDVFESP